MMLCACVQGALELLAIPDVRMLLEEGGLDWKSLRAVATGNVEAGTEVVNSSASGSPSALCSLSIRHRDVSACLIWACACKIDVVHSVAA